MRKLLAAIAVLACIGLGLAAVAALSLDRIIADNRERILHRATAALGRDLALDNISVSLRGGLGVRLENVRIADDPRFSDTDFARAAAVTVRARLWPLLSGELDVRGVDVTEPQIHLIRNRDGEWNYAGLMARVTADRAPGSAALPHIVNVAAAAPAPAMLSVAIGRATVEGGTLVVSDRTQQPARITRATEIGLTLNGVSDSTPVQFSLAAALPDDDRKNNGINVDLHGSIGPLQSTDAIPLQADGTVGPFGSPGLRVEDLHFEGSVTADSLRAEQLRGRALGGSFDLRGQLPRRAAGSATLQGELTGINLKQLAQLAGPEAASQIEGSARLVSDLRASGSSVESLQGSLTGTIDASVDNGTIKDMNVVRLALERLSGVPGLANLLSERIKPRYARLLSDRDTRFETLRARLRIADQRVNTDDIAIVATDYGLRAKGWVRFDREVNLSGTLLMSQQFSRDVTADVKEAKYILDDNGQLAIPLRLQGELGKAKPIPDNDALIAMLARGMERGGAADLLHRFLGGKQRKPAAAAGQPTPNRLKEGLRKLFGR